MQGLVRLKIVFAAHAPVKSSRPSAYETILGKKPETPLYCNAMRMALEFQRRSFGSEFKVEEPHCVLLRDKDGNVHFTSRVESEVMVPKPGSRSAFDWHDELERRVMAFEESIGARHKAQVYLEDMVI